MRRALRAVATPARAAASARFFKAGPGEYAEGDRFLGVSVPAQRRIAGECANLPLPQLARLLASPWHEERLTALIVLVGQYQAARSTAGRMALHRFYMRQLDRVDNWDLVDTSAEHLVGAWLAGRPTGLLDRLARSPNLWRRRVAMLATFHAIKAGDARDALRIAARLRDDPHDLIHKATGWMLREVGKRVGLAPLRGFLARHAARMPRTMLRYAIERLPATERARWLAAGRRPSRGRQRRARATASRPPAPAR